MNRFLLPILAVLATSGCHTFQPVSVGELAPGTSVRARVTGAYADTLEALLQREDAREIEGTVVSETGSSVLLEVPVEQTLRGMRLSTLNQRVDIPTSAFVEVETKQLDRGRTLAVAGAAAAVLGTIVVVQLSKESGGSTNPGGGGPVEAVVSTDLASTLLAGVRFLIGR